MYSEKLEELISFALSKGELSEKDREIILRRAQKEGEDVDEVNMVLDAKVANLKKEKQVDGDSKEESDCIFSIESLAYWNRKVTFYEYDLPEAKEIHDVYTDTDSKKVSIVLTGKGLLIGNQLHNLDYKGLQTDGLKFFNDKVIIGEDYLRLNSFWYVVEDVAEKRRFSNEIDIPAVADLSELPYWNKEFIVWDVLMSTDLAWAKKKYKLDQNGLHELPNGKTTAINSTSCLKGRGLWIASDNLAFRQDMIMNGQSTLYFSPELEEFHLPKAFAMHEYNDVTFFSHGKYLFDSKIKVSEDCLYTESHMMKWTLISKQFGPGDNSSIYVFSKENNYRNENNNNHRFTFYIQPEEENVNLQEFLNYKKGDNDWSCVQYIPVVKAKERRYVPPKVLGDYFDGDMTEPIESLISKGSSSTMSKGSKSTGNTSTESDDISFPKRLGYALLFIAIIIILLMGC